MKLRLFLFLAFTFVVAQGFRPAKNLGPATPGPEDFLVKHGAPAEVKRMFAVACYDCHSDRTRYPWYADFQPVGWWLAQHVREGKDELNLSTLGAAGPKKQARRTEAMIDEIKDRKMPLPSYTWTHHDAVFTPAQRQELIGWLEAVLAKLPAEE